MKILYVTTVSNTVNAFLIPHIRMLVEEGHKVDVAFNVDKKVSSELKSLGCNIHEIPFERTPFTVNNLRAYKQIENIISKEKYDLVHTHTPVASAIVRHACKNMNDTKIFYTAHGFHFFDGAPTKNRLFFYPVEKLLSRWTDTLITINEEDYERAKTFDAREVKLVNGVGIDLEEFKPSTTSEKIRLRDRYGYDNDGFIMICVGELNYNKHQDLLINVAKKLKKKIPNFLLLLVGNGALEKQYEKQINNLGLEDNIKLLGFRKDVNELMKLSDIGLSASRREGLPVNIMEAMATGLPLVVTDSRGNRDLVTNNENGYVIEMDNEEQFAKAIEKLYYSSELRTEFGKKSLIDIQEYSLQRVLQEIKKIYR